MERAEWIAKMLLGWMCYWPVLWWPWHARSSNSRIFMWALSWAGFYAYGAGFEEWRRLKSHNASFSRGAEAAGRSESAASES